MKEQRITVNIDGSGALHADAEGFSGDTCVKDLERLLEGLASGVERIDRKPQVPDASVVARGATRVATGRKP